MNLYKQRIIDEISLVESDINEVLSRFLNKSNVDQMNVDVVINRSKELERSRSRLDALRFLLGLCED